MITESGSQDTTESDKINLNSFAKILEGVEPLEGNPFRGMGKRKFVQIKLKRINMAFELFAESVVSPAPADRSVGFVESDVTSRHGVIKYNILNDTDKVEERNYSGDYMSFEDFLTEYITSEEAKYSLECYMDELIEAAEVDDEFLMKMNQLWTDREINTPRIYNITIC